MHTRHELALVAVAMLTVTLLGPESAAAQAQRSADTLTMRISHRAERPEQPGPVAWFTGTVHVTPLFGALHRRRPSREPR